MSSELRDIPDGSAVSPDGFSAGAAAAGLKAGGALDVALLVSASSCATAGVFTRNTMRAAPVIYDQELLAEKPGRMRAVAMNARVANACTGAPETSGPPPAPSARRRRPSSDWERRRGLRRLRPSSLAWVCVAGPPMSSQRGS